MNITVLAKRRDCLVLFFVFFFHMPDIYGTVRSTSTKGNIRQIIDIIFVQCAEDRIPILGCVQKAILFNKINKDISIETASFTSLQNCEERVLEFRSYFNKEHVDGALMNIGLIISAAVESTLITVSNLVEIKKINLDITQLRSNMKELLRLRSNSYLDQKNFKRMENSIISESSNIHTRLKTFQSALESAANYLENSGAGIFQKESIIKLKESAKEVSKISEIYNSPSGILENSTELESRLKIAQNSAKEALRSIRSHYSKSLDLQEIDYKNKLRNAKFNIRKYKLDTAKNCAGNIFLAFIMFWQENYEDQILPRILESSTSTIIAKDEYLILNSIDPKTYCSRIMADKTIQKITERRLSLGEYLVNYMKLNKNP